MVVGCERGIARASAAIGVYYGVGVAQAALNHPGNGVAFRTQ